MIDVQKILGKDLDKVDSIIRSLEEHVHVFTIPKRSGGTRTITAPDDELKKLHHRIASKLLIKYHPEDSAHGFVRERSILSNALPHVGAKSIGKMDIESFFDTISPNHIKYAICGNKHICKFCSNYPMMMAGKCSPSIYHNREEKFEIKCEELKTLFVDNYAEDNKYSSLLGRVVDLMTYKGSACQGFPTSPYLANIVLAGFDRFALDLAQRHDCEYTRYADDLTFSSKVLDAEQLRAVFEDAVTHKLFGFGFKIKKKKTKFKQRGRFQTCGVVVNVKPNVSKWRIKRFRAMVHNVVTGKYPMTEKKMNKLKGWASYLMHINKEKGNKYMKQLTDFEKAAA